jgi:hypothetical protein
MLPHVGPEAEEEFGKRTPWDSVTKLEWAHTNLNAGHWLIVWRLIALTDIARSDLVSPIGLDMLDPSLVLFKFDLLVELINVQAGKCGLSTDKLKVLLAVLESHEAYQDYLDDNTRMPWMLTMPPSVREFIAVVGVGWPTNTCRH